jgi:hypothetical protein
MQMIKQNIHKLRHENTSRRLSENRAFDDDGSVNGAVPSPVFFFSGKQMRNQASKQAEVQVYFTSGAKTCHISLFCKFCCENFAQIMMTGMSFDFCFFFFFFCWRYNPLWVLAFSVSFFHSVLSLLSVLHPLIPIVCISSSVSSIHLFFATTV